MMRTSKRQRRLPSVAVDCGVRQHGSHERVAASMRRIARPMTTANHSTSNHNAVFAVAANAIPVGEDGAERNGPPKTSHHTVVPGCTNPRRGSRTTDGMISADASNASAATLAIASNVVARSHQRRTTWLMQLPNVVLCGGPSWRLKMARRWRSARSSYGLGLLG